MEKYINKKLYSDVISYRVFDINEKAGTAMAIEVERDFTPEWVPGGFSAICTNIKNQDNAPVKDKDGAEPFAITRNKDGVWGIKCKDLLFCWQRKAIGEENVQRQLALGNSFIEKDKNGNEMVCVYRMTKGGKIGTTFRKLGKLSNSCGVYYDYNF